MSWLDLLLEYVEVTVAGLQQLHIAKVLVIDKSTQ